MGGNLRQQSLAQGKATFPDTYVGPQTSRRTQIFVLRRCHRMPSHSLLNPVASAKESSLTAVSSSTFFQSVPHSKSFTICWKCSSHARLSLHPHFPCSAQVTKDPLLALPASNSLYLSILYSGDKSHHSCQVTPLLRNFQWLPIA